MVTVTCSAKVPGPSTSAKSHDKHNYILAESTTSGVNDDGGNITNGDSSGSLETRLLGNFLREDRGLRTRFGRQAREEGEEAATAAGEPAQSQETSTEPEAESKSKSSIGLSQILGILFLVCCIIYCIGISYKIYKICQGTYVEEEPVFLKYK